VVLGPQWSPPLSGGTTHSTPVTKPVCGAAAMEPAAERRDDFMLRGQLNGLKLAAMEPAAERRDDGSRNPLLLTCGNTEPCEHLFARGKNETAIELSSSRKQPLTCMRASPGV
jgi:hypothetical protein